MAKVNKDEEREYLAAAGKVKLSKSKSAPKVSVTERKKRTKAATASERRMSEDLRRLSESGRLGSIDLEDLSQREKKEIHKNYMQSVEDAGGYEESSDFSAERDPDTGELSFYSTEQGGVNPVATAERSASNLDHSTAALEDEPYDSSAAQDITEKAAQESGAGFEKIKYDKDKTTGDTEDWRDLSGPSTPVSPESRSTSRSSRRTTFKRNPREAAVRQSEFLDWTQKQRVEFQSSKEELEELNKLAVDSGESPIYTPENAGRQPNETKDRYGNAIGGRERISAGKGDPNLPQGKRAYGLRSVSAAAVSPTVKEQRLRQGLASIRNEAQRGGVPRRTVIKRKSKSIMDDYGNEVKVHRQVETGRLAPHPEDWNDADRPEGFVDPVTDESHLTSPQFRNLLSKNQMSGILGAGTIVGGTSVSVGPNTSTRIGGQRVGRVSGNWDELLDTSPKPYDEPLDTAGPKTQPGLPHPQAGQPTGRTYVDENGKTQQELHPTVIPNPAYQPLDTDGFPIDETYDDVIYKFDFPKGYKGKVMKAADAARLYQAGKLEKNPNLPLSLTGKSIPYNRDNPDSDVTFVQREADIQRGATRQEEARLSDEAESLGTEDVTDRMINNELMGYETGGERAGRQVTGGEAINEGLGREARGTVESIKRKPIPVKINGEDSTVMSSTPNINEVLDLIVPPKVEQVPAFHRRRGDSKNSRRNPVTEISGNRAPVWIAEGDSQPSEYKDTITDDMGNEVKVKPRGRWVPSTEAPPTRQATTTRVTKGSSRNTESGGRYAREGLITSGRAKNATEAGLIIAKSIRDMISGRTNVKYARDNDEVEAGLPVFPGATGQPVPAYDKSMYSPSEVFAARQFGKTHQDYLDMLADERRETDRTTIIDSASGTRVPRPSREDTAASIAQSRRNAIDAANAAKPGLLKRAGTAELETHIGNSIFNSSGKKVRDATPEEMSRKSDIASQVAKAVKGNDYGKASELLLNLKKVTTNTTPDIIPGIDTMGSPPSGTKILKSGKRKGLEVPDTDFKKKLRNAYSASPRAKALREQSKQTAEYEQDSRNVDLILSGRAPETMMAPLPEGWHSMSDADKKASGYVPGRTMMKTPKGVTGPYERFSEPVYKETGQVVPKETQKEEDIFRPVTIGNTVDKEFSFGGSQSRYRMETWPETQSRVRTERTPRSTIIPTPKTRSPESIAMLERKVERLKASGNPNAQEIIDRHTSTIEDYKRNLGPQF